MTVKPIPEGYHTVTPYLIVRGADKTLEFAKKAFDAEVIGDLMRRPDGKIMHAEFKVGNSILMISEATEQHPPASSMLYVYVPDVDATYKQAIEAGATPTMEPADKFYGDRTGSVKDAAGVDWVIGTHKEDVSPQEIKKRAAEMLKKQQGKAA